MYKNWNYQYEQRENNNINNKNEDEENAHSDNESISFLDIKSKEKYPLMQTLLNKLINVENEKIKLKTNFMFIEEKNIEKLRKNNLYKTLILYSGGYIIFILVLIIAIIWEITIIEGNVYLAKWSEKMEKNNLDENINHFMIYILFGIVSIFSLFLEEFLISKISFNLIKNFHNIMLENIINAPINLHQDKIQTKEIMNKFTTDLDKTVKFFFHFSTTLKLVYTLLGSIIVCVSSNFYVFIFFCGYKISVFWNPAKYDISKIGSADNKALIAFCSE